MELDDLLSRLDGVRRTASGVSALCPVPAHDDHKASLRVNEGREGGLVVHCHGTCSTEDVMAAIGLSMADLSAKPHVVETYTYTDDYGRPLWYVDRWVPKDFRCRPGLPPPAQRVLYRADALKWARERNATVYYVEGERDANRLADLGLVSTCNVGGAGTGKWLPHYAQQLDGTHLIVVADNDEVGRAHARTVAKGCASTALTVNSVVPRYGKDLSEMFDLGWGLEHLDPLPECEELGIVLASNLREEEIDWAWEGYVPFGMVTIVEGDPGDGKSILSCDLSARWSSGAPMPDGSRHRGPYRVLLVNAEDDPSKTMLPRLRSAGADLGRIQIMTFGTDPARPFSFGRDLTATAQRVVQDGIRIVIFDPLMALLDDGVDSHSDHSIRRALYPLHRFAMDSGAAVLIIRHLNKGTGGKAVYRGGGSIGIGGAARAVYAVGRDPEEPQTRRVLASVKMNVAPQPASLAYSINQQDQGPILEWHGRVDSNAQEVMDGWARKNSEDAEIVKFLNEVVEDEPLSWREICEAGESYGYSAKMLRTRRDRSRLIKITGSEGRRSTRWGYMAHVRPHLPEVGHMPAKSPESPCPGGTPSGHVPVTPPSRAKAIGEHGGPMEDAGQMDPIDRDAALDALPLVCQVCRSETEVTRWASPYWVIRCANHNPLTYGGE